jgi:hypothetical protein
MLAAIFPLQALLLVRHSALPGQLNLALSVFPCINSAPRALRKWCKMSNGYPESSPQGRRCWAHGGAIWPRLAHKKGYVARLNPMLTSGGCVVANQFKPTLKFPHKCITHWLKPTGIHHRAQTIMYNPRNYNA